MKTDTKKNSKHSNQKKKRTGGNIHDNGTIEISSNSIFSSSHHPKNSLDYQSSKIYLSKDERGSSVFFDFKERSVQLSSYSIQSPGKNFAHLKNWAIEVADDKEKWIEIDRHTDDPTLNGYGKNSLFNVSNPQSKFYRYVRLLQTGEGWNCNFIGFTFIEFYGKLQEPKTWKTDFCF